MDGLLVVHRNSELIMKAHWNKRDSGLTSQKKIQINCWIFELFAVISIKRGKEFMHTLLQDVHFTLRQARRSPAYYGLIILILALGIGANCAIFSKINQALFKPLPCQDEKRLVKLTTLTQDVPFDGVSYADLQDFKEQNRAFERIGAMIYANPMIARGSGEPIRVARWDITPEFLGVFGTRPVLGRGIEPGDCKSESSKVMVITPAMWKRVFNGRPDVVGQIVMMDDKPYTVVGVLSGNFWFPYFTNMEDALGGTGTAFMPLIQHSYIVQDRSARFIAAYGLIKKESSVAQARMEFADFTNRLETLYPKTNLHTRGQVLDLHSVLVGEGKNSLMLLFAAVGIVLLIACTNVANLLLAKATVREREMAIRVSLGASHWRLSRQMLTESLLLGVLGGLAGLLVARGGLYFFNLMVYQSAPTATEFQLDWRILAYALSVSLLTGLLFGLAPVWHNFGLNLNDSLKETGSNISSSLTKRRFQKILVWVEITLSMMLLVGAGLLMRSLWRLWQVNPRFKTDRVIYAMISASRLKHAKREQVAAFYSQIQSRLESIPGVEKASLNGAVPMSHTSTSVDITRIAEKPEVTLAARSRFEIVGTSYFDTLHIPLKRGRDFSPLDRYGAPRVMIINEAMARKYWGNLDPVGSHLLDEQEPITVVGVAGDTHSNSLEEPVEPIFYFPAAQTIMGQWMFAIVRGSPGATGLVERLKQELQSMDATLFVDQPKLLEKSLLSTITDRNEMLTMIGSFALLALLLTLTGIYGVLSHFVAQRTREIGIRIAMGADAGDLIRMVMKQALWIALIGVAAGIAAAFGLSRYIASHLYGVTKNDPATYIGTALLFLAVASVAAYIPARRATRVEPIEALRAE